MKYLRIILLAWCLCLGAAQCAAGAVSVSGSGTKNDPRVTTYSRMSFEGSIQVTTDTCITTWCEKTPDGLGTVHKTVQVLSHINNAARCGYTTQCTATTKTMTPALSVAIVGGKTNTAVSALKGDTIIGDGKSTVTAIDRQRQITIIAGESRLNLINDIIITVKDPVKGGYAADLVFAAASVPKGGLIVALQDEQKQNTAVLQPGQGSGILQNLALTPDKQYTLCAGSDTLTFCIAVKDAVATTTCTTRNEWQERYAINGCPDTGDDVYIAGMMLLAAVAVMVLAKNIGSKR